MSWVGQIFFKSRRGITLSLCSPFSFEPSHFLKKISLYPKSRTLKFPSLLHSFLRFFLFQLMDTVCMVDIPTTCWSRSHFKLDTQCDLQVNNMCEAFNRAILDIRENHIITLLEGIKHYLTKRITHRKDLRLRYRGNICPIVQQTLERSKIVAGGWTTTWHSDDDLALFGVTNGTETYIVNLLSRTCACRKWQLTGVPCCHAIPCIWYNRKDPEDYVSYYYR